MRLRHGAVALAALLCLAGCTGEGVASTHDTKPGNPKNFVWSDDVQPAAASKGATYRDVQAGGTTAAEVIYDRSGDDTDQKPERALAVSTKDGTAILVLSGLDNGEFAAMLPAYLLARETMTT